MSTLKWYNGKKWETLYTGAFKDIISNIKNLILSINNLAAAIRQRGVRKKNLSDMTDAADCRTHIKAINDMSDPANIPQDNASHTHSKYYDDIQAIVRQADAKYSSLQSQVSAAQASECTACSSFNPS